MPKPSVLRVAVAGIGGFAGYHHSALSILEDEGEVRVVAACDPHLAALGSACQDHRFASRGVHLDIDFSAMIARHAGAIDWVIVASPSQFHPAMHRTCAERGLACYLEKPPTADPAELEQMIDRDRRQSFATHVGFHFVPQKSRQDLKCRIAAGEFGRCLRASLLAFGARPASYFQRNTWAGRLIVGDDLVLDSCCGNALSHYVNNVLDLMGSARDGTAARPVSVEAELYRTHPIEAMDTVFARAIMPDGGELRVALSHACPDAYQMVETLEFENATIEIRNTTDFVIRSAEGGQETWQTPFDSVEDNLRHYLNYLRGRIVRPAIRLEDCRGLVELHALLYLAAPAIHSVDDTFLTEETVADVTEPVLCLQNITEAATDFLAGGGFPSQSGWPWAGPSGTSQSSDLPNLRAGVSLLLSNRPAVSPLSHRHD